MFEIVTPSTVVFVHSWSVKPCRCSETVYLAIESITKMERDGDFVKWCSCRKGVEEGIGWGMVVEPIARWQPLQSSPQRLEYQRNINRSRTNRKGSTLYIRAIHSYIIIETLIPCTLIVVLLPFRCVDVIFLSHGPPAPIPYHGNVVADRYR